MTPPLRKIPPAPRPVRWRAVVLRGWGFGFFGIVATGFGSLLSWMLWLGATSSHYAVAERRLADPGVERSRANGEIFRVEVTRGEIAHFAFRFQDARGTTQEAECIDRIEPRGSVARWKVGEHADVEYVRDTPHVARLVGTRVAFVVPWHHYGLLGLVAPGLAALAVWFAKMVHARRILSLGDVAVAEAVHCREVALSMPTMLAVEFRFLDRHANLVHARETIPARSALGQLALEAGARLAVVHDRREPRRHVLAMPDDFSMPTATSERSAP
ncbi:MAG: hypothetical protein AB7I19_07660 [Planctomycetota bacterium]